MRLYHLFFIGIFLSLTNPISSKIENQTSGKSKIVNLTNVESLKINDTMIEKEQIDKLNSQFRWQANFKEEFTSEEFMSSKFLDSCIEKIIKIELGKHYNIISISDIGELENAREQENIRRKEAVKMGAVIYGPIELTEEIFENYFFSQLDLSIRRALEKEYPIDEAILKDLYKEYKSQYYKKYKLIQRKLSEEKMTYTMPREEVVFTGYYTFEEVKGDIYQKYINMKYNEILKEKKEKVIVEYNGEVLIYE